MGLGGTATVADDPLSLSLFLRSSCLITAIYESCLSNWLDNVSVGLQAGKAKIAICQISHRANGEALDQPGLVVLYVQITQFIVVNNLHNAATTNC